MSEHYVPKPASVMEHSVLFVETPANAKRITRACSLLPELITALEGFIKRHSVPEVTADPENDPLGECICGNCCQGRAALAKARAES